MIQVETVLDLWWQLAGLFSGGVLGLFLLGRFYAKASKAAGLAGVLAGLIVIAWMALSPQNWGLLDAHALLATGSTVTLSRPANDEIEPSQTIHLQYVRDDRSGSANSEIETRTVVSVSEGGKQVSLDEPLPMLTSKSVVIFNDSIWFHCRSPFHNYLAIVFGTGAVLLVGVSVSIVGTWLRLPLQVSQH
jgi:hypothetical protein